PVSHVRPSRRTDLRADHRPYSLYGWCYGHVRLCTPASMFVIIHLWNLISKKNYQNDQKIGLSRRSVGWE
ncbi:unnamed protein product, partial [Nesidiocoris tenuis]